MPQSTALLNWASLYSTISPFLQSTSGSSDWLRIFISPDAAGGGHFITHGIDFGATYSGGIRGLVPGNSGTLNKTFLRGDGWSALWTAADETASAVGSTSAQLAAAKELYMQTTLASVYDIKQWIALSFAANNAMRFKGIITIDAEGNISTTTENGTTNGFPTECVVGDTYKINGDTQGSSSYIGGQFVGTGDMVICVKVGTGANLNDAQYWTIVQDNVEHLITYTLNGVAHYFYAQSGNNITIFAPSTSGTSGQVLVSAGANQAPTWANANTLVVLEANHVTNALTAGTGIKMLNQGVNATSYNGSNAITITLNPATTSSIGGVIIDNGTNSEAYNAASNTSHTAYPTITVNDGQIYLTKQNIINALGFTPGNAVGQVAAVKVGSAATSTDNTTVATVNPYINILDGSNTVLGSYQIQGSGKITVSSVASSAAIIVGLGEADASYYGGIKIGYTAPADSPKNYALQLDFNGKAYVNVPWVSDVFTDAANGLAPMASDANKKTNNVDNVAGATTYILGSDAKWYKLPASAFQSDRRIINLKGTTIIGATSGNALNVIAGDHINITAAQISGNYTGALTFNAVWRDIQVRSVSGSGVSQNVESIGDNDPLVFDNTDTVFMLGEEVTVGSGANATTKTVIKSYITWYNMDTGEYEMI